MFVIIIIVMKQPMPFDANSPWRAPLFVVDVVPKQLGRALTVAMSCPSLLAEQQAPNAPFLFAPHRLSSVAFSASTSSHAAQARAAARSSKEDRERERESFICCFRGEMCVGREKERKRERENNRKDKT